MNNVKVLENETKAPVQFTVYYQHNYSITLKAFRFNAIRNPGE